VRVKRYRTRILFGLAALLGYLLSGADLKFFVAALILAFGLRLVYVLVRWRARRPLLTGWIFVIALALLVTTAFDSHGRRLHRASLVAVRQGVVASAADATPRDRCVGRYLDWWDAGGKKKRAPGWTKARFRAFLDDVCRRAEAERVLHDDGSVAYKPLDRIWHEVGAETSS
jgi:hypothetical protein